MKLIQKLPYNGRLYDAFTNKSHDIYMSREQIGRALEYAEPGKAIDKIHHRHESELDRFSVIVKLTATDGKRYDTVFYSRRGIFAICMYSRQPKAKEFLNTVFDRLEDLAAGQYLVQFQKENHLLQWQATRDYSKAATALLTDVIKDFNDYASRQGSIKFHHYAYINLLKLIRSMTAKYSRDDCTIEALHVVAAACKIVKRAVLDGMAEGRFYRAIYDDCKKRLKEARKMGILD